MPKNEFIPDFDIEAAAIPEARYYKIKILDILNEAITYSANYNQLEALSVKHERKIMHKDRVINHTKLQGCLVALYSYLRVKMNKKESEELKDLKERIRKGGLLPIERLDEILEILTKKIDDIGITKIEIEQVPKERTLA